MTNELLTILSSINWNYGRGEITSITFNAGTMRSGHFHVKMQFGTAKYSWRIVGKSVYAHGHQRRISIKWLDSHPV